MKINKLSPRGFCSGVKYSLKLLDEAINNNNTKKPIYILGSIIHNSHVINEYLKKGIILLEDKEKSKEELLKSIESGTVVFSAHGVKPSLYEIAKNKGLDIIDAVCPYVKIIHNNIIDYLNKGYDIIYIGVNNHPEAIGVLGISSKIHFINNINEISELNIKNNNIYVTNQTTLSLIEIEELYNLIKKIYPQAIIDNKICRSTTNRQLAVINQEPVDLCIVVGDKKSSNTKKLKEASESVGIKSILCEDYESLDKASLDKIESISITSGASTPDYLVDEIIEKIKML